MPESRIVAALAATALGLATPGCSDHQNSPPGAAAAPTEPATPAATPRAEAAEGPEFDIESIDASHWIIGDDVLVELALAASAGDIAAKPQSGGLVLQRIADGSLLLRLGFAPGDVIRSINDLPVTAANDLRAAHAAVRGAGEVRLVLERGGTRTTRHYYLRSKILESNQPFQLSSSPAHDRLVAALASGVKATGDGRFDIDRRVLATLADHPGLLDVRTHIDSPRGVQANPHRPATLEALGLSRYDVVKAVNDVDVARSTDLGTQLGAQREATGFTVSVVRVRDPLILHYRVVADLAMDADLAAAATEWEQAEGAILGGLNRPAPPRRPAPSLDGISEIEPGVFRIERKTLDQVLADPSTMARGARIVPSIKNGKPHGFKLYAIRPSSIYAALGLHNGDTILAANGFVLDTPDKALEAYTQLRSAKTIVVELERRGKPMKLEYRIE